jgi:predicted secreted protein
MRFDAVPIRLLALAVLSAVILAGCAAKSPAEPLVTGVPETGLVIDLAARNGEIIAATPGDVLYLQLSGSKERYQWTAVAPTSSSILILKDQKVTGPTTATASTTVEWWFKVEQPGTTDIEFEYGQALEPVEATFAVTVVSQ